MKHFRGWFLVNLVMLHFGKKGPKKRVNALQRDLNPAIINQIFENGGGAKGEQLMRRDPKHAVTIILSDKFLKEGILNRDPNGPFHKAEWEEEAMTGTVLLPDGEHRTAVLLKIMEATIKALKGEEKKGGQDHKRIAALWKVIEEGGWWLAGGFSEGKSFVTHNRNNPVTFDFRISQCQPTRKANIHPPSLQQQ